MQLKISENIDLIKATREHSHVISNLMQFYIYDFSEYNNADVEENGLYAGYPDLESYWKEEKNKFPYLIKKDGKYSGFVLIRYDESAKPGHFSIAEFFVLKKYRRTGIGRTVAYQVFNLHKGQWQVFQMENNKPAQSFWNNIIRDFTKGQFTDRIENGRRIQEFTNQESSEER